MLTADALSLLTTDFGSWSTDPARPDYACPAYLEMAPRWQLCRDIRAGTVAIRAKRQFYLPKFESEALEDWGSRVGMTFVADHYATTLVEHVGLVFSNPLKLGDDVPDALRALCEDIDGQGTHLDVFAQATMDDALHLGHCVLFTDYPVADAIRTKGDATRANARPYVTRYPASDIMSWRTTVVGGVQVLTQIVFRETMQEADAGFGTKEHVRFREVTQAVSYDAVTGRATGLGAITWRLLEEADASTEAGGEFREVDAGLMVGPAHIPARVMYGGLRTGYLQSIPHLMGLAFSNIEETQVASDYAAIMHKCNVPTPIFIGRNVGLGDGATQTVQMGIGIDIPLGGDAKMLEPTGVAIAATRQRIEDLRTQMRRQGATSGDESGKVMTAIEAKIYAKQRNAKLSRAARSEQDALEGMLADFAAFMGLPDGGSVAVNQDFAESGIDPTYLTVLVAAYKEGAMPLDALLYALEKGTLPDDFSASDAALRLVADELAKQDAALAEAKRLALNPPAVPVLPPAIVPPPQPPPAA